MSVKTGFEQSDKVSSELLSLCLGINLSSTWVVIATQIGRAIKKSKQLTNVSKRCGGSWWSSRRRGDARLEATTCQSANASSAPLPGLHCIAYFFSIHCIGTLSRWFSWSDELWCCSGASKTLCYHWQRLDICSWIVQV